jgi:DNA-binding transcriptional ArsR family regulator
MRERLARENPPLARRLLRFSPHGLTGLDFVRPRAPPASARAFPLMALEWSMDLLLQIAQTIACPTRLHILRCLGPDGLCVSDAAEQAGVSCSTASFHLSKLIESKLAVRRRRGRQRIYAWSRTRCSISLEELPESPISSQ